MVASERKMPAVGHRRNSLVHLIVNPAAGNGRAGKRWRGYARELERHGYRADAHLTSGPGDATRLARELAASGAEIILCVGGDGTANEVVNGLIVEDEPVNPATCLGLIPCGTGKDLGRSIGSRTIDAALQALAEGSTAIIDVGRMRYIDTHTGYLKSRYFANVADTGIGAATAERINASSKRFGGLVSYMTGAVRSIASFEPWDTIVEVDGQPIYSGMAGMVVFANGQYFAGGMHVAPEASLCDGMLDIFVLEGVGRRALLTSLLPRVYRGKHVGQPGVTALQGRTASVRSTSQMLLEMDGEQVGQAPVEVTVVPRVLTVIGLAETLAGAGGCIPAAR